jgi:hypothetical protein
MRAELRDARALDAKQTRYPLLDLGKIMLRVADDEVIVSRVLVALEGPDAFLMNKPHVVLGQMEILSIDKARHERRRLEGKQLVQRVEGGLGEPNVLMHPQMSYAVGQGVSLHAEHASDFVEGVFFKVQLPNKCGLALNLIHWRRWR